MVIDAIKEFPFSMAVAWEALHHPSKLDVEPGSEVEEISDTEWKAHNKESGSVTHYTASFDDDEKVLTIEAVSNKKHDHDFMYLTLKEIEAEKVSLEIRIEIDTGIHLLARAVGALLAKPMQEIMSKHIYHNFKALCKGEETKRLSKEELDEMAKKSFEK